MINHVEERLANLFSLLPTDARVVFNAIGRYFELRKFSQRYIILEEHVMSSWSAIGMFNVGCVSIALAWVSNG